MAPSNAPQSGRHTPRRPNNLNYWQFCRPHIAKLRALLLPSTGPRHWPTQLEPVPHCFMQLVVLVKASRQPGSALHAAASAGHLAAPQAQALAKSASQSSGQVAAVSPLSHDPLPQPPLLAGAGQSGAQFEVVSPGSHVPSPQMVPAVAATQPEKPQAATAPALGFWSAMSLQKPTQLLSTQLAKHCAELAKNEVHSVLAKQVDVALAQAFFKHAITPTVSGSQSIWQAMAFSPGVHTPSPQTEGGGGQSIQQVDHVSPAVHAPSPQTPCGTAVSPSLASGSAPASVGARSAAEESADVVSGLLVSAPAESGLAVGTESTPLASASWPAVGCTSPPPDQLRSSELPSLGDQPAPVPSLLLDPQAATATARIARIHQGLRQPAVELCPAWQSSQPKAGSPAGSRRLPSAAGAPNLRGSGGVGLIPSW